MKNPMKVMSAGALCGLALSLFATSFAYAQADGAPTLETLWRGGEPTVVGTPTGDSAEVEAAVDLFRDVHCATDSENTYYIGHMEGNRLDPFLTAPQETMEPGPDGSWGFTNQIQHGPLRGTQVKAQFKPVRPGQIKMQMQLSRQGKKPLHVQVEVPMTQIYQRPAKPEPPKPELPKPELPKPELPKGKDKKSHEPVRTMPGNPTPAPSASGSNTEAGTPR